MNLLEWRALGRWKREILIREVAYRLVQNMTDEQLVDYVEEDLVNLYHEDDEHFLDVMHKLGIGSYNDVIDSRTKME